MFKGLDDPQPETLGTPEVLLGAADPHSAASSVQPAGAVVLLLSTERDPGAAAELARLLSGAWTHPGGELILVDLHLETPLLDGNGGAHASEGIVDLLLYGASLRRIARRAPEGFSIVSAGTYAADSGEVYGHPRWERLITEAGARLVLLAPAGAAGVEALIARADDIVVLGGNADEAVLASIRAAGKAPLAIVRFAEGGEAADAAPPPLPDDSDDAPYDVLLDGDFESDGDDLLDIDDELELPPSSSRSRRPRRGGVIVLWLFVFAALLGVAAYLLASLRPDLFSAGPGAPVASAEAATAASGVSGVSKVGDLLLYSVQVRAFTSFDAALAAIQAEQRRIPSTPLFLSPEEIQGTVYHRILAGFAADTVGATRVRDVLVASGSIEPEDAAGAWSLIQFTPLAFDLGEYPTREDAAARADSLFAREIPTYHVAIPYSDGTQRWKLYAGAYRDSVGAATMRARLAAAGVEARLIARTGESVPPVE